MMTGSQAMSDNDMERIYLYLLEGNNLSKVLYYV